MSPSLLRATALHHSYGSGAVALSGVDLQAVGGRMLALLGPSGSGKSTCLRILAGQIQPTAGRVQLGEEGPPWGSALWRRAVAFVPQGHDLLPRLTVFENVACGRLGHIPTRRGFFGLFDSRDRQQIDDALCGVGIEALVDRRVDTLSGGQRQRVAVARALAQEPRVLLADEPVASLDPAAANSLLELLRSLARSRDVAVVLTLHQPDLARTCDDLLFLRAGAPLHAGPAEALSEADLRSLYAGASE